MKSRKCWLDGLRAAAACAVVLMHTLTGVVDIMNTGQYRDGEQMLVVMDLVTWCVPVFLMISGYLFLDPERQISLGRMLKKYCLRIGLALLVFGIPFSVLELVLKEQTVRLGMLWDGLVMVLTMQSWSHLWYLYVILLLYILTPGIKWVLAKMPGVAFGVVMLVLAAGSSIMPFVNLLLDDRVLWVLPDGMIYLFYYLMGYALQGGVQSDDLRTAGHKRAQHILGTIISILIGGMVCSRLFGGWQLQMAYNYPPTVILSVALMLFAQKCQWKGAFFEKAVLSLAKLSFTVYLVHPVFLNLLYKALDFAPQEYPLLLWLPGVSIVVLGLSVVSAVILHRIKPLKKYVL